MTIAFIDQHRRRFAVAAMCRVLELAERTFYAAMARPVSARSITDETRKTIISVEWKANYACYGHVGYTSICDASTTRTSTTTAGSSRWDRTGN